MTATAYVLTHTNIGMHTCTLSHTHTHTHTYIRTHTQQEHFIFAFSSLHLLLPLVVMVHHCDVSVEEQHCVSFSFFSMRNETNLSVFNCLSYQTACHIETWLCVHLRTHMQVLVGGAGA